MVCCMSVRCFGYANSIALTHFLRPFVLSTITLLHTAHMKIGIIAPAIENVPPKMYGGTERVVSALTEELIRRGHAVTLFASGQSQTSARLISTFSTPLREAFPQKDGIMSRIKFSLMHLGNAYSMQDEFDIIHDHTGYFGLTYAQSSRIPVVSTLHGNLTPDVIPAYKMFARPYLVSISHSQRQPA